MATGNDTSQDPQHPPPLVSADATTFPAVQDGAHRFRFLTTGAEALYELEALIQGAQQSVVLEMYIFRADLVGNRIRNALLEARRRAVSVRVLLDDFGSAELPRHYFDELIAAGAELRMFNPSRALRAAFRNHRKLCVVDHRAAIVGGFNIGTEYDGDGVTGGWRDLGMHIEGPLVDDLEATFNRMFIAASADTRALIAFARGLARPTEPLRRPALLTVGPGFQSEQLRKMLIKDFQASHRVAIIAAYFTPPWRLRRALRKVALRGIVRVVLPGKSDVPVMRLAAQHLYDRMLRHRVEVYEYQPQILHAKLVVADDIVYVGSCNFDVRSLQLNFDMLVRIPNSELAVQARTLFAGDMAQSAAITLPEWDAAVGFWGRTVRLVAYWLATRFDPFLARRYRRSLR